MISGAGDSNNSIVSLDYKKLGILRALQNRNNVTDTSMNFNFIT